MPRVKKSEVAAAMKPSRTPAQLANDARLRAGKAKKTPAKQLDSPDFHVKRNMIGPDDVGQPHNEIAISTTGKATAERTLNLDIVQPGSMLAKAENEKYMNEPVEIIIEADDDPNAPLFVHSAHNGVTQYIERGKNQIIKRKFLYSLLAAKSARLVCSFGRDQNGKEFNRLAGPSRTTHRVVVINDTARGRADYVKWMSEA